MRRSAVLRDVPHAELESRLGNYLETGWTVTMAHPMTMTQMTGQITVWTIFLETEFDYVPANGPV